MRHEPFLAPPGKKIRLKDHDPGFTGKYKGKDGAEGKLKDDIERLANLQDVLYAQNTWAAF